VLALRITLNLPNPSFAKMIVMTANEKERDRLILHLRQQLASGFASEARIRAVRFVYGPYTPWPVAFRVMGPDLDTVQSIADQVLAKVQANLARRKNPQRRPSFW
jgi:multidrug efflux pump subunit AcrB